MASPHFAEDAAADVRECIRQCQLCDATCSEMVTHSLRIGGRCAEAAHIRLLLDCAELCRLCAGFLLRGSELEARVCGLCADVCELCGINCERLGNDAGIKHCAQVCLRCSGQCRKIERPSA